MKKLEAAGKKTGESVKKKVDAGMDNLEKTYDKVRDYFKSEQEKQTVKNRER